MTEPLSEQEVSQIEKMLSGSYTWDSLIQHTHDLISSHRLIQQERDDLKQQLKATKAELGDYTF